MPIQSVKPEESVQKNGVSGRFVGNEVKWGTGFIRTPCPSESTRARRSRSASSRQVTFPDPAERAARLPAPCSRSTQGAAGLPGAGRRERAVRRWLVILVAACSRAGRIPTGRRVKTVPSSANGKPLPIPMRTTTARRRSYEFVRPVAPSRPVGGEERWASRRQQRGCRTDGAREHRRGGHGRVGVPRLRRRVDLLSRAALNAGRPALLSAPGDVTVDTNDKRFRVEIDCGNLRRVDGFGPRSSALARGRVGTFRSTAAFSPTTCPSRKTSLVTASR